MQKTILCATDLSGSSSYAIKCAASLAHDLNAHLTVLYTYRLNSENGDEIFAGKKKKEQEAAHSFSILEKDFLVNQGITYDLKTEIGFLSDRIEALSRKTELSFIVISKDMNVKSKEAFEELMEESQVPIVIAR